MSGGRVKRKKPEMEDDTSSETIRGGPLELCQRSPRCNAKPRRKQERKGKKKKKSRKRKRNPEARLEWRWEEGREGRGAGHGRSEKK